MTATNPSEEEMKTAPGGYHGEPAIGIPYGYPPSAPGQPSGGFEYPPPVMQPPPQQPTFHYIYRDRNPYIEGLVPANAIYGSPNGVALRETFFGDTPAPFECPLCGKQGVTRVTSSPSIAACVACLMTLFGVCFLSSCTDCLWNKHHYCPNCGEKVADFKKSDPCMVVDVPQWIQRSYALPA